MLSDITYGTGRVIISINVFQFLCCDVSVFKYVLNNCGRTFVGY